MVQHRSLFVPACAVVGVSSFCLSYFEHSSSHAARLLTFALLVLAGLTATRSARVHFKSRWPVAAICLLAFSCMALGAILNPRSFATWLSAPAPHR